MAFERTVLENVNTQPCQNIFDTMSADVCMWSIELANWERPGYSRDLDTVYRCVLLKLLTTMAETHRKMQVKASTVHVALPY